MTASQQPRTPPASEGAGPHLEQPMRIVHRADIPTLRTVVVDGEEHNLGILKDFRKHPDLAGFLPEDARLALSWVRLEPGEVLAPHVHPIESMIVVAHGMGRTLGDLEEDFADGDIVLIPRGRLHGFVGAGDWGFWALSVQFEQRGLYEDPDRALVDFAAPATAADDGPERSFEALIERNAAYCDEHTRNPIFDLVRSGRLDDPARRRRFLDCVHVWSTQFQRAVLARAALTEDATAAALARQHLDEEYGHDVQLAADRGEELGAVWDPVLDAASKWFSWKMLALDNLEKTVLVHLVLEGAAATFHAVAEPAMAPYGETTYFAVHNEADEHHERMAHEALRGQTHDTYRRLLQVQREGWDMLNTLCARMAELADAAAG